MRVVLDANVVFAGAGWRGEAHNCLLAMARRRIAVFATFEILEEVRTLVTERGSKFKHAPDNLLTWYYERVKLVEPASLGKQRSRDVKDDPYLACALAAGAKVIVSRDEDLLVLEKPFGIRIITPRELLTRLSRPI
ncbi:MAG TPA: putative toxin-antitoxin system toxin component, PIN family [Verrucomicrobiae bacterium]